MLWVWVQTLFTAAPNETRYPVYMFLLWPEWFQQTQQYNNRRCVELLALQLANWWTCVCGKTCLSTQLLELLNRRKAFCYSPMKLVNINFTSVVYNNLVCRCSKTKTGCLIGDITIVCQSLNQLGRLFFTDVLVFTSSEEMQLNIDFVLFFNWLFCFGATLWQHLIQF